MYVLQSSGYYVVIFHSFVRKAEQILSQNKIRIKLGSARLPNLSHFVVNNDVEVGIQAYWILKLISQIEKDEY